MSPRRPVEPAASGVVAPAPDDLRLTSPAAVRRLLDAAGVRPSRALGQNFLVDANILRIVLDAADLRPDDRVLEIGAGLGVLTGALAARVACVLTIEKDARLLELARRRLAATPGIEWLRADALDVDLEARLAGGLNKVVSNLPYSAGTDLLLALACAEHRPARMVVTLQADVADRLAAAPGAASYGPLSVAVQLVCEVRRVHAVSPTCFWPVPAVWSAVVRLDRRPPPAGGVGRVADFAAFVRASFAPRRKQIGSILSGRAGAEGDARAWLAEAAVPPAARPEDLAVDDWCRLWAARERRAGRVP